MRGREIMESISAFVATAVIMVLTEPSNSFHLAEIELWNDYIGLNSSYSTEDIFLKQDSVTRISRNSLQAKPIINITTLYANSLSFADRVLTYLESNPLQMTMEELRPYVRSLLQELDFLKVVEDFVADHLGVTTPCDAHVLYTLLDLYSALEERRQTHLQKVMERLLLEASMFQDIPGRQANPLSFLVKGFAIHIKRFRDRMTRMYSGLTGQSSLLEPRTSFSLPVTDLEVFRNWSS
ncbi:uncharacterized protein LOC135199417 isoform X3 [Macrobrachium nipponense]